MRIALEFQRASGKPALEQRSNIEDPTVPVSSQSFFEFFGMGGGAHLPRVSIDRALQVPAVNAAVSFLARTMATLPLHAYRRTPDGPVRISGGLETLVHDAPNPEWSSYAWREYMFRQTFTGGRGLSWIERSGSNIVALWPMDPRGTTVRRTNGRKFYTCEGKTYSAADVIDIPFALKADMTTAYSPIVMGTKAIQLGLAMNDYASKFFAGGGVPPLALVGPLPAGAQAIQRATSDISRAIDAARESNNPVFPLPPGYDLKPVAIDPAKGQMTDARRFQIEEYSRIWQLPPVFLSDLSHGTFTNTEQQDLHLVKHVIGQWACASEQELNLKLFGQRNTTRYVEYNLDGIMRGDFKSRIEAMAMGVNSALLKPDEARALDNRPKAPGGDKLYIQGATVPLGSNINGGANDPGKTSDQQPA
jgi:HK97 family phage portal protein